MGPAIPSRWTRPLATSSLCMFASAANQEFHLLPSEVTTPREDQLTLGHRQGNAHRKLTIVFHFEISRNEKIWRILYLGIKTQFLSYAHLLNQVSSFAALALVGLKQ